MPKVVDDAPLLKPFTFQGLVFSGRSGTNVTTKCFFCDRDGKLHVNPENGLWDCKVCAKKGNVKDFLKGLWEESRKVKNDYSSLAKERKLLFPSTLEDWGLCKSIISGHWMLPGYAIDALTRRPKLSQLYLWREDPVEKRKRFICQGFENSDDGKKTTHGLFVHRWDPKKREVHLLEGLWDGAAWSEILPRTKVEEGNYSAIGSPSSSLYADVNIIATPGANVFYESWCPAFAGKKVTILYDNDHSRKHEKTGSIIEGSGIAGTKRVVEQLSSFPERPESVHYLNWGPGGFDPSLPNRYDVRDHLSKGSTDRERVKFLGEVLEKVTPIDPEWIGGTEKDKKKGSVAAKPLACTTWKELREQWGKAMFWSEGLDTALASMLACAASVFLPEDLLWLKVVSPASTGKTELAEALALAEDAVVIVSTFTGLHSGMRLEDGEDGSLISHLGGKCFIIKEGDTLLQIPEVWAELRDAYDRNTRTHFKNGVSNKYLENPFTHILCGTASLHEMDDSELGQRYLDVVIMDRIQVSVERSINKHKLTGLFDSLKKAPIVNGQGSSTSAKQRAKQLTAGYLQYLRANLGEIISAVDATEENKEAFSDYAQFVAFFRARPSQSQTEEASREMSARLAVQLAKLAFGLAAVMQKIEIDEDIMSRIKKVALDTARGTTFNIGRRLYDNHEDGLDTTSIAGYLLQGDTETREMLRFLRKIDVVEVFMKEGKIGSGTRQKWRLSKDVYSLFKRVMER